MSISREVLAKYIKPGCRFIETGTRWGDTCIRAVELGAHEVWSCEADSLMAVIAQLHVNDAIRRSDVIRICEGESVRFLNAGFPAGDNTNSVLFLDAHSGDSSPVIQELDAVCKWKSAPKAILIDDLRCFDLWKVDKTRVFKILIDMGYRLSFESGVCPEDILVAQR
jgi:hypothetical protein